MNNWKSILFLGISFLVSSFAYSQIENLRADDHFTINRFYGGIRHTSSFTLDSLQYQNLVTFRTGALVTYKIDAHLSVRSFGVVHVENGKDTGGFGSLELLYAPSPKLRFHIGQVTTPTTELRPNPTTWQSQVETNAQATILGGRLGVKAWYEFNKNWSLTQGAFYQNNRLAYHARINYKKISLAGYLEENGAVFLVSDINTSHFHGILTWGKQEQIASSLFLKLKNEFHLFYDLEYDLNENSFSYATYGLRKYYALPDLHIQGFAGLAFESIQRSIQGTFFIHLK